MFFCIQSLILMAQKQLRYMPAKIPSSVIIQLARILHTSPNYILLGEVKEEGWMEEMYELMENIKLSEIRRLALKQLRCVAEV